VSLIKNVVSEVSVEVLDDGPRWSFGTLAANFARVQLLISWYDGDPDRYLAAIDGGIEDVTDTPFLLSMKRRLREEPRLLDDMRRIVNEFANQIASV
jgi:hypothetical protein